MLTAKGVQLVLTLDSSNLTKSLAKEDSGKENERLESKQEVESETAFRSFWKRFWAE